MQIEQIELINFKNIKDAQVDFHPKANCFVGLNGMGKTSVLDAIHYLSTCKSFLNAIDSQNVLWNEDFFMIKGLFGIRSKSEEVLVSMKSGGKKVVKRNQKDYKKFSEHLGLLPLVIISPADIDLLWKGSDERRKFVDSILAQYDSNYLHDLISYQKVLLQRNTLLKSAADSGKLDLEILEIFDLQLKEFGMKIYTVRTNFIEEFKPFFQKSYAEICGGNESVSLEYNSAVQEIDYSAGLKENLKKDKILKYTSFGVHKDDLEFLISGVPIKKSGSQGQQKTYLTSLRFAQYLYVQAQAKLKPMLLLDDIFDKLDEQRVSAIVNLLNTDTFGQIIITDTDESRLRKVFNDAHGAKFFNVHQGVISELI